MTPARPRLAEVLAALTDLPFDLCSVWPVDEFVVDSRGVRVLVHLGTGMPTAVTNHAVWITHDPAEAWEVLQTRGIIPADYRGAFLCPQCDGTGRRDRFVNAECLDCDETGVRPHPASLPDLVAWASLGFAPSDDGSHLGILGAEEMIGRSHDSVARWSVAATPDEWTTGLTDSVVQRIATAGIGVRLPSVDPPILVVPQLNIPASRPSDGA